MSVISGIVGGEAAKTAANTQSDSANEAIRAQLEMYYKGREDTAPWREAGTNALNKLVSKVNMGPGKFEESPGYQFRMDEGQKALERSAAARGNLFSGATGKALTRYGQDYATGEYQNFLANYYNSLTPYQSLAGVGQTTASQNALTGNQVAGQIGQNMMASGNAQAAGMINQANAYTGASNSGVNNYLMWKYMNPSAANAGVGSGVTGMYSTGEIAPAATTYFESNPELLYGAG